jgi:histidine triad (HIT) family protein
MASAFSIRAGIITNMPQESEEPSEESCVFCDIVAGKRAAHRIWEDELTLCVLDINPFSQGHSLVIPKRHVPWWHELSEEENASLFRGAGIVARKMMACIQPDFVCMYARGRRIPHTHIFLVPTEAGDVLDRFFNALELFQESPQQLAGLREEEAMEKAADLIRQAKTQ